MELNFFYLPNQTIPTNNLELMRSKDKRTILFTQTQVNVLIVLKAEKLTVLK
jgi:hypothetical protein